MQPTVFEAQNEIDLSGLYIIKDSFEKYIDCQQINNEQRNYKFNVNHNNLLTKGDIFLYYSDSKKINVLFGNYLKHNTLLLTEKCNSKCVFCSQPPNKKDDSWLWSNAEDVIKNLDTDKVIGLTGGEVTLDKSRFYKFLENISEERSELKLHILTNGRNFKDFSFAKDICQINNKNLKIQWGIPLYSHNSDTHDNIVNSKNAWNETVDGLINLLSLDQSIELRVIPVLENYKEDLVNTAEFISRFLPTINVVSIMALEKKGWAVKNWRDVFIPYDELLSINLGKVINRFVTSNINVCLYNYPLCMLKEDLWEYCVKSISDWKNIYRDECDKCYVKNKCCGLFAWDNSTNVKPIN
jgi:His-Xaa-Ser system radical SAM maturase HxsC